MTHASALGRRSPLAILALQLSTLAVLAAAPAAAQLKHTSDVYEPTHQYLSGQALELLENDPGSLPEMLAELREHIGEPIVDWCFWKDTNNRFNFTYGGKENHSQGGPKASRCSRADQGFAVPYANYTAAQWQDLEDNNAETVGTDGNDIIEGVHEEDQYDPLRETYVTGIGSACRVLNRHFWEPDDYNGGAFNNGLDSFVCSFTPEGDRGSAVNKAEVYWARAKTEYRQGHKDLAYYYLGRVAHLLEDMSSTPHTHQDAHPPVDPDDFEQYMGGKAADWDHDPATGEIGTANLGFDNNYLRWGWDHTSRASVVLVPVDPENLPAAIVQEWYGSRHGHRDTRDDCVDVGDCFDDGWPDWAFRHAQASEARARLELYSRSPLFRLFYSMAETTDDYPSDDEEGDNRDLDDDNDLGPVNQQHIVAYANAILPAAISHVAGLYRLFWSETHVSAAPPYMLILLDRTGSMTARRASGNSRCRDALVIAREDARSFFAAGGSLAAVWSFSSGGILNLTGGFTGEAGVNAALNGLSPEGCGNDTPLAQALCAASDALAAAFPSAGHGDRLLAVSSDGGENDSSGPCSGANSASDAPFDEGSWQRRTLDHVINQNSVLVRFWDSLSKSARDVETGELAVTAADSGFFDELAHLSGGTSTRIGDNGSFPPPFQPVPADASCAGGLAIDDGSFENAFSSTDTFPGTVAFVQRFTTGAPTALGSACLCFTQRNQAQALPFALSVLDDDGPQGGPGTVLGQVSGLAAAVPTFPGGQFYKVDLRGLPTDGSFYLGPSWVPNQAQSKFWICVDTTGNRARPAYFRFDQGAWSKLTDVTAAYSALGIRTQPTCTPDATTLCLNNGRFKLQMGWEDSQGRHGTGQAVALTSDTGYFWFFDRNNVEAVIKVLDACAQAYWVFAGGLTDVETALTVTDTVTGKVKTYRNPKGTAFQPIQDTSAFTTCNAGSRAATAAAVSPEPAVSPEDFDALPLFAPAANLTANCVAGPTTLCLNNGRFRVTARFRTAAGPGTGQAVGLTNDTGYFWFFNRNNVEVVLKVLDACGLPDRRFWVFGAGLTSVEVDLTVVDTVTTAQRIYHNDLGAPFQPIQDTRAFACP